MQSSIGVSMPLIMDSVIPLIEFRNKVSCILALVIFIVDIIKFPFVILWNIKIFNVFIMWYINAYVKDERNFSGFSFQYGLTKMSLYLNI